MATQSQWDSIPDVAEQTPLPNGPIKVRWSKSSRDRARVRRGLTAALEDGYMEKAIARPCMSRQKTQVVIKTEEELEAFQSELEWVSPKWKTRKRIEREIERQYNGEEESEPERSEAYQRRKAETDMDLLMEEIVVPHAEKKAHEVWNGTVKVDDISWFWNHHLRSCAGRAYWRGAEPSKRYDVTSPAVGLSPDYYYAHGIDELLKTVRHELIHIWQYRHEMGKTSGGHGTDFKQWLDDMDTDRYCKHY